MQAHALHTTPHRFGSPGVWLGILIPAVLLAGLGWAEWRGWPFLKTPLEERLTAKLHHPVKFDSGFELHLLGALRVRTGLLEVGQPAWVKGEEANAPMLKADHVSLEVPYGTLFQAMRGKPMDDWHVGAVELASLDARLTRDKSGRANWALSDTGQAPATPPGKKPATMPHVDRLVVREGKLLIDDEALRLHMKTTLSTAEGEANPKGAGLVVNGEGTYLEHPFVMHVAAVGALPLLTDPAQAPPVPITIRAGAGPSKLSFDGTTRDLLSLGSLEGQLELKGPSLAAIGDVVGVTLPTTAPFDMNGTLKKDGDLWGFLLKELHVGDSRLNGEFSFDRRRYPPVLQGKLSGSRLALVDLAPAFGAATKGAPNPKPPDGFVLPRREFDVPSLRAMNANVQVNIQKVTLGDWFAQPLEPLQAKIDLTGGVLNITDLLARAAGGSVSGSLRMNGNGPRLLWDTKLNWAGIKLEDWLKTPDKKQLADAKKTPDKVDDREAQAKVQEQSKPAYISGQLIGQATLHGEGNSTASLLGSLEGNTTTWIKNGQISRLVVEGISLHVAEALGLLITGDKQQPMQCAAARLRAHQGELIPEVAIVDTPSATILASGSVSLAKESLDVTLKSRPKSLSPLSLRTPVDVQGTFADPNIKLHSNPLGFKVVAAAALATIAPLAGLIPLIDTGKDHDSGCGQVLQSLQVKDAGKK